MVPASLRVWFVIHFVADILFAVPLLVAPVWTLELAGWTTVDPIATRSVAAALMGIGTESLLCRNAGREVFVAMLNLKIIWSGTVIIGLTWTMLQGGPPMGWAMLGIFVTFSALWAYYRLRLGRTDSPTT